MCEGRRVRQSGENATLQIVDRLDYQSSWEHKAAVVRCLVKPSRGSENAAVTAAENPRLPTVAQLMLSQELAMERQEVSKARAATLAAQRKGLETALAAGNKPETYKLRSKEKLRSERVAQQAFLVQKAETAKPAKSS